MKFLFLFCIFLSNYTFAQNITSAELLKLSTLQKLEAVEKILNKGFSLVNHRDVGSDQYGEYDEVDYFSYGSDNNVIRIDLHYNKDNSIKIIDICFNGSLDKKYKTIESQIKSSLKKTRFFFNNSFNLYFSEYLYKGKYVYLTRGICVSEDAKIKYGSIIIQDYKIE